jgi:integrase/recombinase XerD
MAVNKRGRPVGISGQALVLKPNEVNTVLRLARTRSRVPDRSEVALCMSLFLGLRAKEIAALKWGDVFDEDGKPRDVLRLMSAYTKGAKTRDVYLSAPHLRKVLVNYGWLLKPMKSPESPLIRSQKGGHMSAASMARYLKGLYREAGLTRAPSIADQHDFAGRSPTFFAGEPPDSFPPLGDMEVELIGVTDCTSFLPRECAANRMAKLFISKLATH